MESPLPRRQWALFSVRAASASEQLMHKLDSTIDWLERQRGNAVQAVQNLKLGHRIDLNGTDVTTEWIARYQRLIERYGRLIERYEQQVREGNLRDALTFRE
jgi:hypothetical protein